MSVDETVAFVAASNVIDTVSTDSATSSLTPVNTMFWPYDPAAIVILFAVKLLVKSVPSTAASLEATVNVSSDAASV